MNNKTSPVTEASETIVLAFSGGLDTSYCILALREQGFDVQTVFVDTGGMTQAELQWIHDRAMQLGAKHHHQLDASQAIWDEFVTPLVWSHARVLGEYPMLCSDRYLIVKLCLELCDDLGTAHFAHGCTGMGNDQLRRRRGPKLPDGYAILGTQTIDPAIGGAEEQVSPAKRGRRVDSAVCGETPKWLAVRKAKGLDPV